MTGTEASYADLGHFSRPAIQARGPVARCFWTHALLRCGCGCVNSASCQCSLHASPAACWLRARAHHRYTTRLCTREAQASRRKGVTAASPGARARSRPPAAPRDAAGSRTLAKRHAPCRAQIAFCGIAYPSLVITYFGQAAFLMANPDQVGSTFFASIPFSDGFYWTFFVIATAAACVASQARG